MVPRVTAVVLAYGDEPWVERCVEALLASRGVAIDVVVVDNGCKTGAPARLRARRSVEVVVPGANLGFAGGCNAGAERADGEYLALVNGDAVVEPDAVRHLVEALGPDVGLCSGSIRLWNDRDRLNSAGNPVHFSGLSWAGGFGEAASGHADDRDVASASGAGLLLRRALWKELGGFAPEYFAYLEDAELSWRVWQRGLRVRYVAEAVVIHRYEFSRNDRKNYLLERNRLIWLLTLLERRTLLVLSPALIVVEACVVVMACQQGWWRYKLAGWRWIVRERRWVLDRRRQLQEERAVPDEELLHLLSGRLTMTNVPRPRGMLFVDRCLSWWWWVAGAVLRAKSSPTLSRE